MLYLHIRAKPNIMKVMYIISKILTLAGLAQSKMICLLFCKNSTTAKETYNNIVWYRTKHTEVWRLAHLVLNSVWEGSWFESKLCVFLKLVCNILYCFSKAVSLMCLKHLRCRFKPYTACNVPLTYMQSLLLGTVVDCNFSCRF